MFVAHSNSHIYLYVHACYLFQLFFIVIGVFGLIIHSNFSFVVILHICHDCNIFSLCFHKFSLNALFILKIWYIVHLFCVFLLLFHLLKFFVFLILQFLFLIFFAFNICCVFFLQVSFCHCFPILNQNFLHEVVLA